MDFVNDIDFELRIGGRVFTGFAEFADLFDAVVACAVNLQNVERTAFGYFDATRVVVVETHLRSAVAIQAFGKDTGDGCFASSARSAKKIGVGDAFLRDGIGERLRDVFLTDNVGETLRAILSRYDLITHENLKMPG